MAKNNKPVRFVRDVVKMSFDVVDIVRLGLDEDGEPVTCSVEREIHIASPYTPELREQAYRARGREGFSYGKAVCILPSARFYNPYAAAAEERRAKREYLMDALGLEFERDEED